jgi:phosphatidate cytidylyltransferase
VRAAAIANLGLLLTVFSLSHIALLRQLPDATNPVGGAVGWVVFLLLITQLNDVAQYVFGKCFGRRPIAPRASPKKTVEGFAGGVAASAIVAAWIGPLVSPMETATSSIAGMVLAVAGFGGDMAVSALKRAFGVKDAGSPAAGARGSSRPRRQPYRHVTVVLLLRLLCFCRALMRLPTPRRGRSMSGGGSS